jgi:hypothetical protein
LTDPTVIREVSGHKGRYAIMRDGAEAEMTFSIASRTL